MDEQIKKRKQKKRLSTIVTLVVVSVFAVCALAGCASEGQQPLGFWEVICIGVADIVAFFYPPFQDWGMAIIMGVLMLCIIVCFIVVMILGPVNSTSSSSLISSSAV